ncbi:polysaccharide deacetylase family protein [Streptomyces sp. E11-3]|uniref:polysaccharide deacetylase family protein n=1 Tax=Streptomyces sp. E11-3 TaxID=3110112 RepID=UPI00397FE1FF
MRRTRVTLAVLVPVLLLLGLAGPAHAAAPDETWPEPVPVVTKVDTDDPVVFITIDDGWGADQATGALKLLRDRRVPASLFLLPGAYEAYPDHYRTLLANGPSRVENHTVSHPDLTKLSYQMQRAEVCGARDRQLAAFGDSPRLFRPSGGATYPWPYYNDDTRTVARACGAEALVMWTHDLSWGQQFKQELRSGDIILLHMGATLEADLTRALDAADAAGLKPANLRRYIAD